MRLTWAACNVVPLKADEDAVMAIAKNRQQWPQQSLPAHLVHVLDCRPVVQVLHGMGHSICALK